MIWLLAQQVGQAGHLAERAVDAAHRTSELAHRAAASSAMIKLPDNWPGQMDLLVACDKMGPLPAVLLIAGGIVFLMFGLQFYKWLVTINAAIVGAALGALIGEKMGGALPGGILGGFSAAAVTWPLMRWAVAAMGGLFGALLGGTLWRSAELDPHFLWAGALIGLVFCGLLCFILFRGSIMAYTSLQGSVMLIFGLLGLFYNYKPMKEGISQGLAVKPFLLPLAIFIPAILGLLYQQTGAAPASGAPAKR